MRECIQNNSKSENSHKTSKLTTVLSTRAKYVCYVKYV